MKSFIHQQHPPSRIASHHERGALICRVPLIFNYSLIYYHRRHWLRCTSCTPCPIALAAHGVPRRASFKCILHVQHRTCAPIDARHLLEPNKERARCIVKQVREELDDLFWFRWQVLIRFDGGLISVGWAKFFSRDTINGRFSLPILVPVVEHCDTLSNEFFARDNALSSARQLWQN